MSSNPTSQARRRRQKLKRKYARVREDAQLAGIIEISPEGAVRDESVDPRTQDEQRFPGLDRAAIANDGKGWAVPEKEKRKVIEKNVEVLYERKVVYDDAGNEIVLPPDRAAIEKASRVLLAADQAQFERDQPEESGKAKGGGAQVGVTVVNWDALCKRPENVLDPLEAALNTLPQSCPQGPEENANGDVPPTERSE